MTEDLKAPSPSTTAAENEVDPETYQYFEQAPLYKGVDPSVQGSYDPMANFGPPTFSQRLPVIIQMGVFYLIFWAVMMGILALCYPFAQQFAKPIMSLIFPINESNSMLKTLIVASGFYWGSILVSHLFFKPKQ